MSKNQSEIKALSPAPTITDVTCPVELFNEILATLQKLPYSQVSVLMDKIKTGFRVVNLPAPSEKP